MHRPWKPTHCGGMGELIKKFWISTQSIPPSSIIKPYCKKGVGYERVNTTCCL